MAPTKSAVGNLPDREPLRWTAAKAAREFGTTNYLMRKRLADGREAPDGGGCYATSQIINVLYGSLHAERLRKTAAEEDAVEMSNAVSRAELLVRSDLEPAMWQIAEAIKTIIRSSPLDRESQAGVLRSISRMRVIVADQAARQTRSRVNGSNGATPQPALRGNNGATTKRKKSRAKERAGAETVVAPAA
jgi:hypothetical protein